MVSGIMGLPMAFQQSGVLLAVIGMILIAAVSNHCVLLLVECKVHLQASGNRVKSYGDVSYHAAGTLGGTVVTLRLDISIAFSLLWDCASVDATMCYNDCSSLFRHTSRMFESCCLHLLLCCVSFDFL